MKIVVLLAITILSTFSFGTDTPTSPQFIDGILQPSVDKTLPPPSKLPTIHCDFADYGFKTSVPIHLGNDD